MAIYEKLDSESAFKVVIATDEAAHNILISCENNCSNIIDQVWIVLHLAWLPTWLLLNKQYTKLTTLITRAQLNNFKI